jgi:predicted phosphodiesterase
VAGPLTRVISDVHFADRSSRVRSLGQLDPLLEGVSALVMNGDTLDTRMGKRPQWTEERRQEVLAYFRSAGIPVTLLTGNHDPDISAVHSEELEGGRVFVTHGDVMFDDIVPWSTEASRIRARIAEALSSLPAGTAGTFEGRVAAFRRVAAALPQRHQSERNFFKYAARLAGDTVWPPTRALTILRAWRSVPSLAAALAAEHRPRAQVVVVGHTHKPGAWKTPGGTAVINSGAFCVPFGAYAVDIRGGVVRAVRLEARRGSYRPGRVVAEYPLS